MSLRTLRFYEEIGLLRPTRVGPSRVYAPGDKVKLDLILTGRRLGFSLRQIAGLIDAGRGNGEDPTITSRLSPPEIADQIAVLEGRLRDTEAAIEQLRAAAPASSASAA